MIDDATQQAKPSLTLPSPPQPSFPAFITASGIDRFQVADRQAVGDEIEISFGGHAHSLARSHAFRRA